MKQAVLDRVVREHKHVQRVNVDFPIALLRAIDAEAERLGIARQAYIKLRLADALRRTEP